MATGTENSGPLVRSKVGLCRDLIAIAWPLMLNNLFNIGINAADTVMAGRLGANQLAAVALDKGDRVGVASYRGRIERWVAQVLSLLAAYSGSPLQ